MNWLTKTNRNEPGIGIIIFYAGLSALILVCGSLSPKAYAVGLNYAGAPHLTMIIIGVGN